MDISAQSLITTKFRTLEKALDISLYVHFPFCSSKCHFCTWVSRIPASQLVRHSVHDRYLSALESQIESYLESLTNDRARRLVRLHSVYFGGGTPTVLNSAGLVRILRKLKDYLPLRATGGTTT